MAAENKAHFAVSSQQLLKKGCQFDLAPSPDNAYFLTLVVFYSRAKFSCFFSQVEASNQHRNIVMLQERSKGQAFTRQSFSFGTTSCTKSNHAVLICVQDGQSLEQGQSV